MMIVLSRTLMALAFIALIVLVTLAFAWNSLGLILWGITLFLSSMFLGGLIGVYNDKRNARATENLRRS